MISIRDEHLEERIDTVRQARGDKTMAKTLGDIAREWLTEKEVTSRLTAHSRFEDDGNPHAEATPSAVASATQIPAESPVTGA